MTRRLPLFSIVLCVFVPISLSHGEPRKSSSTKPLELRVRERIVFVGNTFVERLNKTNILETLLTCRHPEREITFRNLGWSGDNVWGHSRAGFDPPAAGLGKLKKQIEDAAPTVVLVGYGMNESFRGQSGLLSFRDGLTNLLGMLEKTGARIVLVSPIPHEDLGPPLPDGKRHNQKLALYTNAMKEVASAGDHWFVDLFHALRSNHGAPITGNGIHLNEYGAWLAARAVVDVLLGPPPVDRASSNTVDINTNEKARVRRVQRSKIQSQLPEPLPPRSAPPTIQRSAGRLVRARGLRSGRWELRIDGTKVIDRSAAEWSQGVAVTTGPEFEQLRAIGLRIARKNDLFFHRWRPHNTTYLLGFRRHEQGQNAKEIAELGPAISAIESQIAALRQPVEHTYEFVLIEKGGAK